MRPAKRGARLLFRGTRFLLAGAVDFVYPPRCLGCDGDAARAGDLDGDGGSPHLCAGCRAALGAPGVASAIELGDGTHLPLYAAGSFSGVLETMIHALKFRHATVAAPLLAHAMASAAPPSLRGRSGALLVPAPLDAPRRRERGFNQAELLARAIAGELALAAAPRWIRKHRATRSQTRLGRAARRANVAGSMSAAPGVSFRGRRVWLVDDVATTGATLTELARAVRAAGGEIEGALVTARTPDETS